MKIGKNVFKKSIETFFLKDHILAKDRKIIHKKFLMESLLVL